MARTKQLRFAKPVEPDLRLLRHTRKLLSGMVSKLAMTPGEIKFLYGNDDVKVSFVITDPQARFAFLESRVRLQVSTLEGKPSGLVNLMFAANMVNLYALGLRCVISPGRLRFRREVLIPKGGLDPRTLQLHLDLFLTAWYPVQRAIIGKVQRGKPWHEVLAFLRESPPRYQERVLALEALLQEAGRPTVSLPGERLALGEGDDQVLLTCIDEEAHAAYLLRAWKLEREEARQVKEAEHSPRIEQLLSELNDRNHNTFYSLAWDPKRGIVVRGHVTQRKLERVQTLAFLDMLQQARKVQFFEALGDQPADD